MHIKAVYLSRTKRLKYRGLLTRIRIDRHQILSSLQHKLAGACAEDGTEKIGHTVASAPMLL